MRTNVKRLVRAGALLLVLAGGVVLSAACLGAGEEGEGEGTPPAPEATGSPQPEGPATAEEVLRVYVENLLNRGFSGNCAEARRPNDIGKVCYTLRGQRGDMQAYELGPTFSEFTMLVIVRQKGASWEIVKVENRDPTQPAVPGIPWPIEVGAQLVVAGTGDCLRARESPSLQAPVNACLSDGTEVTVQEGPQEADGYTWWRLQGWGWSAQEWLRYPEEPGELPVPTVTPEG